MRAARMVAVAPVVAAALNAIAFVVVQPPVGDLWAARARESAAASGVGLEYWFGWFAGATTPGSYSIISPYLSVLFGAAGLGALATVASTALCAVAARGAPHPLAATWVAMVAGGFNLWSGRIAFAVGTAFAIAAICAVRYRRVLVGAVAAVLAVLASPVAGAFLVIAGTGVVLVPRGWRTGASCAVASAAATLAVVLWLFPTPGVEPFDAGTARGLALAMCALLIARPAGFVAVPVLASIVGCAVLAAYPTAMGGNFDRIVWIWLPVAVVATARLIAPLSVVCAGAAVFLGMQTTIGDLQLAYAPASAPGQYRALLAELNRLPHLASYRVESAGDGTHAAAYLLLNHAQLARGYETQIDDRLNGAILSSSLTAGTYLRWLDQNAVGYVVLHRTSARRTAEAQLLQRAPHYLARVWANPDWIVFRVRHPVPIVAAPARILDADQANLVIAAPHTGSLPLRVHWSSALSISGIGHARAILRPDGAGWTRLVVVSPGRLVVTG